MIGTERLSRAGGAFEVHSISSARLPAAGTEILRRPEGVFALSRSAYPAFYPSAIRWQVQLLVLLAGALNPARQGATLQPSLAYSIAEFGRLLVSRT